MISSRTTRPPFKLALLLCLCWLFWIDPDIGCVQADSSRATDQALPAVLPLDAAVRWALENNPELAALRQQHGIAAAAVVIARTYPFNPIWENRVQQASGPASAGITNQVPLDQLVLLELEVRGQGVYRREGAYHALTRTDWQI